MELTQTWRIENLPKRPKRFAISKKWTQTSCACNYYTIRFKQNMRKVYRYFFQCEPPLPQQSRQLLIQVIKNAEPQLKEEIGLFSYKGNMVQGLKSNKTTMVTVDSYIMLGQKGEEKVKQKHLVHLKIARVFELDRQSYITEFGKKILQVLNIKFKENLRNTGYVEITRNKYYTRHEIQEEKDNVFVNLNLRTLRGFSFTFVPLVEHDLMARLDLSTKYIQQRNFLELMNVSGSKDAQRHLIGRYVMAYYGNFKIYKIQDIDYEKSPLSEFFLTNQQKTMTYKDYFFKKYDKKIKDLKQPLLKVVTKIDKRKNVEGKVEEIPSYGYMVPQLVKLSGVTDDQATEREFKNLIKMMKRNPQQKNAECEKIREEFCTINKDSVFQIGQQHKVRGYELPRIDYETTGRKTCQKEEIEVLQRIMDPMKLKKNTWMMIYGAQNKRNADQILKSLLFAQKRLGIQIEDPTRIQISQKGQKNFIDRLKKEVIKQEPIFVLAVLNRYEERFYGGLKKILINQLHLVSQFIKSGTVFSKIKQHKSILPIAKLLLQINAKLGKPIWKIHKKHEYWKKTSVMYCALGVNKSMKHRSKCTLSFVGTSNQQMTEFYSYCKFDITKTDGNISKKQFVNLFTGWIKTYMDNEKYLADSIICYRQGSNEFEVIRESEIEIQALKEAIDACSKDKKSIPSIVYIHVNKRTDSKFYEAQSGGKGGLNYQNPLPGTVVLEDLCQADVYEFYLMAQKVTQGTAIPTQYKVLFDNSEIPEDALVELTHEQCYNYANWTGPVKVPSCLQYVTKLSSLMTEHIKQPLVCGEKMKRNLFFL